MNHQYIYLLSYHKLDLSMTFNSKYTDRLNLRLKVSIVFNTLLSYIVY